MNIHNVEVPFGTRSSRYDCVFVWIYAKNCDPYKNYPYNDIPNVSLVLSELRFDGLLGAVGGMVEADDPSLEVAVVREAKEEINYDLPVERLKPLVSYHNTITKSNNHSFSLEVTYEELLEIRTNASTGVHFSAENAGVNLMHICRYLKSNKVECGWNVLLTQNFIGTAKMELQKLVQQENLLVDYVDVKPPKYKMFIDDLRDVEKYYPGEDFVVVRTYQEAVSYVEQHGLPSFVSFDHDLGDTENENEETGYTFAKYLVDYMIDNETPELFEYNVHSANPVGAANIAGVLEHAFKFIRGL